MNIPFINDSDECQHEEIELQTMGSPTHDARWNGQGVSLYRTQGYYEFCADCGERLGHMSYDSEGNVGWEVIESIDIPAEVVEEYREHK